MAYRGFGTGYNSGNQGFGRGYAIDSHDKTSDFSSPHYGAIQPGGGAQFQQRQQYYEVIPTAGRTSDEMNYVGYQPTASRSQDLSYNPYQLYGTSSQVHSIISNTANWVQPAHSTITKSDGYLSPQSGSMTQQYIASQTSPAYNAALLAATTTILQTKVKPVYQQKWRPFSHQSKPRPTNAKTDAPAVRTNEFYCDKCHCSCLGQMAFNDHLRGQKHLKKISQLEQAQTAKTTTSTSKDFMCPLCDITCSSYDTFMAHIKGVKHVKTIKLHEKLGRPIPEIKMPEKPVPPAKPQSRSRPPVAAQTPASAAQPLTRTVEQQDTVAQTPATSAPIPSQVQSTSSADTGDKVDAAGSSEDIVGESFMEKVVGPLGRTSYHCKLCNCHSTDECGSIMHLKGRRHKLEYKKKVDKSYWVPSTSKKRSTSQAPPQSMAPPLPATLPSQPSGPGPLQSSANRGGPWQVGRVNEMPPWNEEMQPAEDSPPVHKIKEDRYFSASNLTQLESLEEYEGRMKNKRFLLGMSEDDRCFNQKHASIYPSDKDLTQVQTAVTVCERMLKNASDYMANQTVSAVTATTGGETSSTMDSGSLTEAPKLSTEEEAKIQRVLKGVMRVGSLAKGLILKGKLEVELIVFCTEKPTKTLLKKLANLLPEMYKTNKVANYNVSLNSDLDQIIVKSMDEPTCTILVSLTCSAFRETSEVPSAPAVPDPPDVLCAERCLHLLAELRHAKWFQACASNLVHCVEVTRVFMDLLERNPALNHLGMWAVELLVQKTSSTCSTPQSRSLAFRRVVEALSSGILLPGGHGIVDPCEKDNADATAHLTDKQRLEITFAAQDILRQIAFRNLRGVLGLPAVAVGPETTATSVKRLGPSTTGLETGEPCEKMAKLQ